MVAPLDSLKLQETLIDVVSFPFRAVYILIQLVIAFVFSPPYPPKQRPHRDIKVAIVGSGLSGVSTAAHLVGHGFDVRIYTADEQVGGIWSCVNSTSGLQISSVLYRFHPSVVWHHFYPHRNEILSEIARIWKKYGLHERTYFDRPVTKVERHPSSTDPKKLGHARWVLNGDYTEIFDAVVVTVGTCGEPKELDLPGQDKFKGEIVHSSRLDRLDPKGKRVVVVGGGASGVEAVELAVELNAKQTYLLARSDKWIIPRNVFVDTALALNPFGRPIPTSFIWEYVLRFFHYRSLWSISPAKDGGLFTTTPVVNNSFLQHLRAGKASYVRGDLLECTERGVKVNLRERGVEKGGPGVEEAIDADVIVVATGFERPKVDFLPDDLFPKGYERPNLYLQNFTTQDWSVLMTNSAFMNAIGTAGHVHIGVYARILALFLLDPETRVEPRDAELWVNLIKFVKRAAPGGQLTFFTYAELCFWVVSFHFFRPRRLKHLPFVLFGLGYD